MRKDKYSKANAEKKAATRRARKAEIDRLISMTTDTAIINGLRALEKKLSIDWTSEEKPEDKERFYKARLAYEFAQQNRTKATATRAWRPWSSDDEKFILEASKTDEELAKHLGRSLWAVRTKRKKLYRRNADLSA